MPPIDDGRLRIEHTGSSRADEVSRHHLGRIGKINLLSEGAVQSDLPHEFIQLVFGCLSSQGHIKNGH